VNAFRLVYPVIRLIANAMAAKTMMDVKREIIYSNTKQKWMLNSSKLCSNISIKVRDHSWKTLDKTASTTGYTTITNTS